MNTVAVIGFGSQSTEILCTLPALVAADVNLQSSATFVTCAGITQVELQLLVQARIQDQRVSTARSDKYVNFQYIESAIVLAASSSGEIRSRLDSTQNNSAAHLFTCAAESIL